MVEGKLQQAFDLAWQAAELYEKAPNYKAGNHERLLLNAADIFLQTQNPAKTPDIMQKALTAISRHVPAGAPETIALNEQLAKAYLVNGDAGKAKIVYERVASLYEKNFGADSVGSVNAQLELVRTAKAARDPATAQRYLDRIDGLTKGLAADHPIRLQVEFEQAMAAIDAGRDSAAAAQFRSIVKQAKPSENVAVRSLARDSFGMLAFIAQRQGDPQTEDRMVEATRGLPQHVGGPQPLFRSVPEVGDSFGSATMELRVSTADGKVKEVRVVESSGDPRYIAIMSKSVLNWRFQPTAGEGASGALVTVRQSVNNAAS
ncbi:hypothetical protein [Niveispirillum sp. KHB5.9]|uniref:hypothetical protein n=1 Tax=Niveispirillum sp. KHB5.9 TaxID=3400269 RepID=UPI003A887CF2